MKTIFLRIYILKSFREKTRKKDSKANSVEKILLIELENTDFSISDQSYASLFDIYTNEFLKTSVSKGLITRDH